jgi:hypothetical protein
MSFVFMYLAELWATAVFWFTTNLNPEDIPPTPIGKTVT